MLVRSKSLQRIKTLQTICNKNNILYLFDNRYKTATKYQKNDVLVDAFK